MKYLDDILFFVGVAFLAIGLFQSPFPFLGWIGVGVPLMYVGWHYGKNN